MMIDMKDTILDLLEKEDDITLSTGENEYYIENDKYSIVYFISFYDKYSVTIEYSLYRSSGYFETETVSMKGYSFKILSIFIINNKDNSEYEVTPDTDIEYTMFVNSDVNDWSDEYECVIGGLFYE